jgi:hypothetical protein
MNCSRFEAREENQTPPRSYTSHGHREDFDFQSSFLIQADYDPTQAPTVVMHSKGEVNPSTSKNISFFCSF